MASGTDYRPALPITNVNDVIDGDNETFKVEISSVTGGNGATESGMQMTVMDNDVAGFTQVGPTDPVGVYYSNPLYLDERQRDFHSCVEYTTARNGLF